MKNKLLPLLLIAYFEIGKAFKVIDMDGLCFFRVPSNILRRYLDMTSLQLSTNKLKYISEDDFPKEAVQRLIYINLQNNSIHGLHEGAFSQMPNLLEIDLSNNLLTEIPILKAPKLRKVIFGYNKIRTITYEAMRHYKALQYLDLRENKITRLRGDTFAENKNLIFLDISNNPLKRIDERGLVGPDELTVLHLENTPLSNFPSEEIMTENKLHKTIIQTIDERSSDLHDISKKIWENPELGYEEYAAHELLTSFLEKEGFSVLRKTPLETSFIARYGTAGGLKVGVLCEYDALPGIGHACGHNLIAEAGIAAALGIKAVLSSKSDLKAEIIVYGTPAEEGGGGKAKMLEKGVFDETDFCMMSHPTPFEIPIPYMLARAQLSIVFHGKPSHAAAAPWEGINALDAAVACYNNISMLRQQIKPTCRVHCVIADGGEKANIIPERSEINCYMRGLTDEDTLGLKNKIESCARGSAASTGCSVDVTEDTPFYSAVKTNKPLIDLYIKHATNLSVPFNDEKYKTQFLASTDMGNVSQTKPSIHPLFKIKTKCPNHTHGFTEATGADENQLPTLNSAKSMAMTAIDVLTQPKLMEQINEDFKK